MTTPPPFQPTPFPYQLDGACAAVWNGHTLIADEPGLGKTIQALLAARIMNTSRVLIICPPILVTNWEKETRRTRNAECINGDILSITAGSKTPEQLLGAGYVIAPDSLVTARRPLEDLLAAWAPDLLIVDEAHRFKSPTARRTKSILRLKNAAAHRIALTGTPIVSSPLDVLPILRILGKLEPIAPTGQEFVAEYTTPAPWKGGRLPITSKLPQLHQLLADHVWTRRTKADVLPQLPTKLRALHHVTPDPAAIRAAHADLDDTIDTWLERHPNPTDEQISELVADALPFTSQLRRATGLAKVPAAVDWISTHLDGAPGDPLIVWTIHRDVTHALAAQIASDRPETHVRVLDGATGHQARAEAVEAYQDGSVDVLIGQIVAAGVGLTLTRGSTALFAETDWTPANVVQAEDRQHRIGQTRPVQITTLIAEHTLDARIHQVLGRTISVLDDLTPGSDHHVTHGSTDTTGPRDIIRQLITDRLTTRQETAA
ncbi:DEAD/DEAH box helicase [Brachybacterium endophyticum]|uniref:DEAD/DEAH box helicase n=1 Tax=Brachybacterium endophyticum TaxID=2182385 RepID=UPI001402EFFA|nr:DEAD/DEAH box helicase [Brachybacterium endophyticum]